MRSLPPPPLDRPTGGGGAVCAVRPAPKGAAVAMPSEGVNESKLASLLAPSPPDGCDAILAWAAGGGGNVSPP